MSIKVQKAPWKIPFNTLATGPYAIKVKLSDLLFEKPDPENPATWTAYTKGGMKLPHDVMAYNPLIFSSTGQLDANANMSLRQKYGFFITKVLYDDRADHKVFEGDAGRGKYYQGDSYTIYDPASALELREEDFCNNQHTFNMYTPPPGTEFDKTGDFYTQSFVLALDGSTSAEVATFIITERDSALESTLPGSDLFPYTSIRLNHPNPTNYVPEVLKLIRFFTGYGVEGSISKIVDGVTVPLLDAFDPLKNIALQHVEVWLRCSWFGDYVDPYSFQQDLTDKSNVQHKQLIVGAGDFAKYDREDILPHVPTTPPREDTLSGILTEETTGSLLIPALGGTSDEATSTVIYPKGWFDQTIDELGGVKVPTDGNVYASGRIFSPTIDELWTYIKKMVSGRDSDTRMPPTTNVLTRSTNRPDLYREENTRLATEPTVPLGDNSIGDPLSKDGSIAVNKAEGINYRVNRNLIAAASIYGQLTDEKFLPYAVEPGESQKPSQVERVDLAEILTSELWGLRDEPFSLRELEALGKGAQFNIELIFNYLLASKVGIGKDASGDGSLFQLHKEFEADIDGEGGNTKWTGVANSVIDEEYGENFGEALPQHTLGTYDPSLHHLKQDVYMSAEGQWRYLFDHVRIPVVNERF